MALRSRALTAVAGRGGMASVTAPADDVRRVVESHRGALSVAAVNGPSHVVVSGDAAALDALLAAYEADGVRTRRIPVDYASHSVHMEIRAEVEKAASGLSPRPSDVPFHSTVTAGRPDTTTLDAAYWYRNLRSQVRFGDTVRGLLDAGFRHFVEVSPHPVLTPAWSGPPRTTAATRRWSGRCGAATAANPGCSGPRRGPRRRNAGGLVPCFDATGAVHVDLPTYAFQRRRTGSTPPRPP
ncbi:acyltransferase domain-containing protein [Streptomyces sp. MNU103]|uniref:acyltransferase domain-containing protein n=1 Tax=Streptomyces sp. MNU103 TaxID=2560024 RepID=UPI00307BBAC0